MEAKTLGEMIRELRLDHDLSLRQLAEKVNKSAPFLSDVELGRRYPSARVLEDIANELDVGVETLEKHDFRESVSTLKYLSQTDPRWGVALRTTAERIKQGRLSPEDLLERVNLENPD